MGEVDMNPQSGLTDRCGACFKPIHSDLGCWFHSDGMMWCDGNAWDQKPDSPFASPATKSDYIKKFKEVWEK